MRVTLIALFVVASLALSPHLVAQHSPPGSDWSVIVGAGAVVAPAHTGSDEYRVLPVPMAQVEFRDRLYLGPSTSGTLGGVLGAYLVRTPRLGLTAELGLGENRPASRSDALAGMADRDVVATAGAGLSYRGGPLEGRIGLVRGLNDQSGLLGTAGLGYTRILGRRLVATAEVSAAFVDARQMRRDFGVTEEEGARRRDLIDTGDARLRPGEGTSYRPDGGLRHVGGGLSLMYLVTERWSVLAFGGLDYLSDEAAASPLVHRREQSSVGLGLLWRP